MVGLGQRINEVEAAYFMSEKYQRKGYTKDAINAFENIIKYQATVSLMYNLRLTLHHLPTTYDTVPH